MKALVFEGINFEIWHTRTCLVLVGGVKPRPEPLCVAGKRWPAGTVFNRLGSKNSGAGYVTLDFDDFGGIRYVGMVRCLDGEFACFTQRDKPKGGYFAWHPIGDMGLVWGTDACSGRVISMDNVLERQ